MSETAIAEILVICENVSTIRRYGRKETEWIGTQALITELNQQLGKETAEDIHELKERS
jgi:hypothetical protein